MSRGKVVHKRLWTADEGTYEMPWCFENWFLVSDERCSYFWRNVTCKNCLRLKEGKDAPGNRAETR